MYLQCTSGDFFHAFLRHVKLTGADNPGKRSKKRYRRIFKLQRYNDTVYTKIFATVKCNDGYSASGIVNE